MPDDSRPHTTRGVIPFSRDDLKLVSRDAAARLATRALHHLQDEPPADAVAGVAMLYAIWCRRLGLDPHDLYEQGRKMLEPSPFHEKANIQVEVLRDFAGMRMAGDPKVAIR